MGVAKLLDRRDDLPGDACEDVRSIVQQSQRASELVRQIRDFSRQSKAERCPLDLVPLLKETAELLGRAFPAGIEIRTEFAEKPMRAVGNAAQLQQAFHNLAINARDAMPEGGVLTVSLSQVRVCQERPGPIPRMSPGDWILLSVRDTGTGIPTEAMKHVFEPYFTTKGADEGTGLGLAQTYGIVQQHGGEIDVSSEAGGGTKQEGDPSGPSRPDRWAESRDLRLGFDPHTPHRRPGFAFEFGFSFDTDRRRELPLSMGYI
jgi:hypothetical protein